MVRGIVNNSECSSFYLLSPSARPQFLFFLLPFALPFMALLLKECLMGLCLCAIIRQCTITLSLNRCHSHCLFCLIVIAALALHILYFNLLGHHSSRTLNQFLFLLSTGFRAAWPSLPHLCRHLSQRPLQILQRAF